MKKSVLKPNKKRKSTEEEVESVPTKVQKLKEDDSLLQSSASLSQQLRKHAETLKINLGEDGVDSLGKWFENAEMEIEIKIESIKIQFDILEEKYLLKIDKFEESVLRDQEKFRDILNSRDKISGISKLEKICKFLNKPIEDDLTLRTSEARRFKLLNVGAINKHIPKYSGIEEAVEFGSYEDVEFYIDYGKLKQNVLDSYLVKAINFNHYSIAQLLVDNDANVDININKQLETCIIRACDAGQFDLVKSLIAKKCNVNARTRKGCTALHQAVKKNHLNIVEFLLKNNASVNKADVRGYPPIFDAISVNNLSIFELLLGNEANVYLKSKSKETALMIAARKKKKVLGIHDFLLCLFAQESNAVEIAKLLIAQEIDINKVSSRNLTAICYAAEANSKEIVEMLIQQKANLEPTDGFCETVLMLACSAPKEKTENICEILIKHGVAVNAQNNSKKTAFMKACEHGRFEDVKTLVKHGADIHLCDYIGENAFFKACKNGHSDIVQYLMDRKADVNCIAGYQKETALMNAIGNGHLNTLKILLASENVDLNVVNMDGMTALIYAAHSKLPDAVEILRILLARDVAVNRKNNQGKTALFFASENNNPALVKLLLEKGANINEVDAHGTTALMRACEREFEQVVEVLLEHKADVKIKNHKNLTAYDIHLRFSRFKDKTALRIFELLLKEDIDINAKDGFGNTALISSCKRGTTGLVRKILKKQPNLNLKNDQQLTALMRASSNSCKGIVEALLKEGADPNQRDIYGCTAFFRALEEMDESMAELLERFDADVTIPNFDHVTPLSFVQNLGEEGEYFCSLINAAIKSAKTKAK